MGNSVACLVTRAPASDFHGGMLWGPEEKGLWLHRGRRTCHPVPQVPQQAWGGVDMSRRWVYRNLLMDVVHERIPAGSLPSAPKTHRLSGAIPVRREGNGFVRVLWPAVRS